MYSISLQQFIRWHLCSGRYLRDFNKKKICPPIYQGRVSCAALRRGLCSREIRWEGKWGEKEGWEKINSFEGKPFGGSGPILVGLVEIEDVINIKKWWELNMYQQFTRMLAIIRFKREFEFKGAFRLCNFVSNFLVAREKLLRKLQARAIFRTRRVWIFIAWIFIARNFIAQWVLDFHWGRVWHAL